MATTKVSTKLLETVGVAEGGTGATTASAAFTAIKQAATTSATGVSELATDAETVTGTDTARVVTPAGLQAKVASATAKGIAELATTAETVTGTDTGRVITPAGLHGALAGLTDTTITAADSVIFADATDSNALKEDTVQGILDLGGGGAWNLIGTEAAPGGGGTATLDVTGLSSTYDTYAIAVTDALPITDNVDAYFRFGDSSGIDSGAGHYSWSIAEKSGGDVATYDGSASDTKIESKLGSSGIGNAAGEGYGAMLFLHRPGDGTVRPMMSGTYNMFNGSTVWHQGNMGGCRNAVITLDRVQFLFSSGNIESGRMTVWGIAHA